MQIPCENIFYNKIIVKFDLYFIFFKKIYTALVYIFKNKTNGSLLKLKKEISVYYNLDILWYILMIAIVFS